MKPEPTFGTNSRVTIFLDDCLMWPDSASAVFEMVTVDAADAPIRELFLIPIVPAANAAAPAVP